MRKVTVLLVLAAVAMWTSVAVAGEHNAAMDNGMTTTVSVGYLSQYMFYGLDVFADNDDAIEPAVMVDFGNGWKIKAAGQWPLDSGNENLKKLDYTVAYCFSAMEGDSMQMDFGLNWTYYDLYDNSSDKADFHEFGAMVSFPNLMDNGIVPHYRLVRFWALDSSDSKAFIPSLISGTSTGSSYNGYVHMVGMNYDFTTESFLQQGKQQEWNFCVDAVYNDEFITTESDWSHVVAKLAAPMECPMGGTLTPMIAYQMTMGDFNLNTDDDEFFWGVSYSYDF